MRIAQVATCSGPVREDRTGSVESLVWLLARELTSLGHEVTVYGCEGSVSAGRTIATLPGSYGDAGTPSDWQLCEWMNMCRAVKDASEFDVIHCHAYLWSLPLGDVCPVPMVHTMHTCPYEDEATLRSFYPEATVTAISRSQWAGVGSIPPAAVIHHGVDVGHFTFRPIPDDYLCFLGRFIPGKGPLEAVAAAKQIGLPIVLAGPPNGYFESHLRPLVDGRDVRYAGPVDRRQRDALLGGARALMYPLRSPEPFGLVQVEAMLCGTPVVATRIGAVPEIVDDGITGAIADDCDGLAGAFARSAKLDRSTVRSVSAERFSCRTMAMEYARLYERVRTRSGTGLG